ncbi:MAG TPA: hypothetical protein VF855_02075 [Acidimicrobiales bacterium]
MPQEPVPAAGNKKDDWAAQLTDTIVNLVETVRSKTTVPAAKIARALVFGVLLSILVVVALVIVSILLVRVFTYLPGNNVWLSHLIVGTMFCIGGLICMTKRHSPTE